MRQGQHSNRRTRNRGRRTPNPATRNYESNGPDVKIRGTAAHVAEKYTALARDAMASGDPIMAENFLQHAEHYNRIVMAYQAKREETLGRQNRIAARNGRATAMEDTSEVATPVEPMVNGEEKPDTLADTEASVSTTETGTELPELVEDVPSEDKVEEPRRRSRKTATRQTARTKTAKTPAASEPMEAVDENATKAPTTQDPQDDPDDLGEGQTPKDEAAA